MREYEVTIIGKTPLLMHQDNIEWADFMTDWQLDPMNKATSKAGDDRTPAWRWIGCVYHDGNVVGMPQANLMRSVMEGGSMIPVGKGQKTFKAQTQSGMMSVDTFWPLTTNTGAHVRWADVEAFKDVASFAEHKKLAGDYGFALLVKRAKIGASKHVRVRPVFDAGWKLTGRIAVWDEQITTDVLRNIFEYAGRYKGIGDWRPSSPKSPGPYGTFEAVIKG